jgi:hypothetical protein
MKQTAVEWLIENSHIIPKNGLNKRELIKQAKQMEKQQMCDFAVGFMMQDRPVVSYWDEQFKKK